MPTTGIAIDRDGTNVGWTVGGGIDYAFASNWFAGIEYRYSQFESRTLTYPIPVLNLGLIALKQEMSNNQLTLRVGYKFTDAPVSLQWLCLRPMPIRTAAGLSGICARCKRG